MSSREILNYCPNYYTIVNFSFSDGDLVSEKIVNIYKNFVFSIDSTKNEELEKLKEIDYVLKKYIDDYEFRSELQKEILTIKVKKDNNVLKNIIDAIIKVFVNYEEYTTRKIFVSRWI